MKECICYLKEVQNLIFNFLKKITKKIIYGIVDEEGPIMNMDNNENKN